MGGVWSSGDLGVGTRARIGKDMQHKVVVMDFGRMSGGRW